MRFYIEKFERSLLNWVRIPDAVTSSLKEAERLKKQIAETYQEPVDNYSIMVEVDEGMLI